ncbi:hypothetical protein G7Z17_g8237 [Cylindrodendrum hubeiense]|uniref:Uncharacterized protein n=1 Tax=Cylindrodendrum hubeiense TaxID=595255 RepID=A0A9P5HBL7_9HYPO|nr:hypothetical protein G7Z17_g8237 [Cylindrodendrum hubeiense]
MHLSTTNWRVEGRRKAAERATVGDAQALEQGTHSRLRQVAPRPIVATHHDESKSGSSSSSSNSALGTLASEVGDYRFEPLPDEMLGLEFAGSSTHDLMTLSRHTADVPRSLDINPLLQPISCVADAQRIWHYALTIILPTLGVKTREGEPLQVALYRSATLEPAVFYATLVGAATQLLTLTQSQADARVLLIAQNKTAEAVRGSLASGTITDGTLFAIMSLALKRNDVSTSMPVAKRYHGGFSSPVRNVGGLDWLGQLQYASTHASMWIQLLRDRLSQGISLPGLADYLQLSDLYRASVNLTRPEFDVYQYTHVSRDDDVIRQLGRWETDSFHVHDTLKEIVNDMRICCQLIKQTFHQNGDLNYFIRLRNEIQYRLLCIHSDSDQDKAELLAIMIFSYGVIFPISDPWPLSQLTKNLCFEILEETAFTDERRQFLLWASVIGGIAAWGGEFQDVYTLTFAKHAKSLGLESWDEAIGIFDKFLWLDTACYAGASLVWSKALMYMETTA